MAVIPSQAFSCVSLAAFSGISVSVFQALNKKKKKKKRQ